MSGYVSLPAIIQVILMDPAYKGGKFGDIRELMMGKFIYFKNTYDSMGKESLYDILIFWRGFIKHTVYKLHIIKVCNFGIVG